MTSKEHSGKRPQAQSGLLTPVRAQRRVPQSGQWGIRSAMKMPRPAMVGQVVEFDQLVGTVGAVGPLSILDQASTQETGSSSLRFSGIDWLASAMNQLTTQDVTGHGVTAADSAKG